MRHHFARPAREPLPCLSGNRKKQPKAPAIANEAPVGNGISKGRTSGPRANAAAVNKAHNGRARFQLSFRGRNAQAATCGMSASDVKVRSTMKIQSQATREELTGLHSMVPKFVMTSRKM